MTMKKRLIISANVLHSSCTALSFSIFWMRLDSLEAYLLTNRTFFWKFTSSSIWKMGICGSHGSSGEEDCSDKGSRLVLWASHLFVFTRLLLACFLAPAVPFARAWCLSAGSSIGEVSLACGFSMKDVSYSSRVSCIRVNKVKSRLGCEYFSCHPRENKSHRAVCLTGRDCTKNNSYRYGIGFMSIYPRTKAMPMETTPDIQSWNPTPSKVSLATSFNLSGFQVNEKTLQAGTRVFCLHDRTEAQF